MRGLLFFSLAVFAAGAFAQTPPPKLEPLPEPPPPPRRPARRPGPPPPPRMPGPAEPQVRIPVQESDKVEEIREGGRIVMLKVTPAGGKPYYLLDTTGNGNWMRRDSLDDGVRVPQWPIKQWD